VLRVLRTKGILTELEIDATLQGAEESVSEGAVKNSISAPEIALMLIPIRTLRTLNATFEKPPGDDQIQNYLTGKTPEL
jgi:hypothetical protein